jgi:hypothetical protein
MVFTEFCLQRCKFYFKTPLKCKHIGLFFISYSYITDFLSQGDARLCNLPLFIPHFLHFFRYWKCIGQGTLVH